MIISQENRLAVLSKLSEILLQERTIIIEANKIDMATAQELDESLRDRLYVDEKKVIDMVNSLNVLVNSEMWEGKVVYQHQHENGIITQNKLIPFGNILIFYESRPDVTIEAAASAFFSGNTILLKGGKEAKNTNLALMRCWHEALDSYNIPRTCIQYLAISREQAMELLNQKSHEIDLIIPRGGQALIDQIKEMTTIPLLVSGRGNNFLYVHSDADLTMAEALIIDGKSRISVCNAIDKVLINKNIDALEKWLNKLIPALTKHNIKVYNWNLGFTDHNENVSDATNDMWAEEFLSSKIMLALVDDIDEACSLINKYSGKHSAVIVTKSDKQANYFGETVDVASILHNTSSRFTDGGHFGLGAEIAISTQKSHARGPVGPNQLLTNKWFTKGTGQTRA
jgi:glutamate-5-semialdehyde dehydrogenase